MKKTILFLLSIWSFSLIGYSQNQLEFDMFTDEYAYETSWDIIDVSSNSIVASNNGYASNETQIPTESIDLPNGNYTFTIYDSADDGICCGYGDGEYSLKDLTTGLFVAEGGSFGTSESTTFVLPYVPPVGGCIDPSAYNYDSQADVDDGSCIYLNSPLQIDLIEVSSGVTGAVDITNAGDERLFIVQQAGTIKILNPETGVVNASTFLTIPSLTSGGEQGLLGLAFHPDYANTGYFYVNYTKTNGDSRIARFQVSDDPDIADASSETVILEQDQPYSNHNAGDLAFGPDGYLYIPFGDGGSGGDPQNNGQSGDTWLGKMLRIDINAVDQGNYGIPADNPFLDDSQVLNEIWAIGLRNTWRFSFDALTGDMWMGDVGQNQWEEIDVEPANSGGGYNYGWRCYEASNDYDMSQCGGISTDDVTMPISEYNHSAGACSVTGGYVYRGDEFPAMYGKYFYVDYCNGVFRSLEAVGDSYLESNFGNGYGSYWATFGEGNDGSIYASGNFGGTIYKLVDLCNSFEPEITIEDNGDLTATEGESYVWIINGEISEELGQSLIDADLVNNTYQVSVTNSNGCASLSDVLDVVNVLEISSINNSLSFYPNPVSNTLNITQGLKGDFEVRIIDSLGKIVIVKTNEKSIDLSALAQGNYIIQVKHGKDVFRNTFVKK